MQYDPFQKKAIEHIDAGHSVIVSAPTGAGKTVIAEHVIRQCLKRRKKVIYTAPIKALSNQKFREFQQEDETCVGILTGDVSINPGAPVQVMTTEIFRNKILENDPSLKDYAWVIFDEIHYLDDEDRGTVWEESLMFLPEHMNALGLSATVPNVEELAAWIESVCGHTVKIVKEHKRPVPLHLFYQCQGKIYDDLKMIRKAGYQHARGGWRGKVPPYISLKPNKLAPLIHELERRDMLPCIYFVFSRRRAQALAEEMHEFDFLSKQEREKIVSLFYQLCERFDILDEPSVNDMQPLIARGIAYHHAGMLPTLKEVIERLFTSRLIKAIFTTETFALGINMPARTVIFDELRKFYGRKFDTLRTRDFYQMAGRAGRRSIDTEGFVFCRINPHYIGQEELKRSIYGQPEKVRSQFSASYATLMNLYRTYHDKLYDIYPRSFHYFQTGKNMRRRAVGMMKAKVDILKERNYIRGEALTEKGEFASKIYGYEMIFGEFFGERQLFNLSPVELGVLVAAAIYEPRKGQGRPELTKRIKRLQKTCDDLIRPINRMEKTVGLSRHQLTKKCFFYLSLAVEAWMKGCDFHRMVSLTDTDEGEIIRYLRMSVQVLRQMLDYPLPDHCRAHVYEALKMLNRDVVDAEKQLRS